jgi:hypothetical protein
LKNPDWIASCTRSWPPTEAISLPDLDEDIGHTLVHYLYTGTYETLGTRNNLSSTDNHTEFKRAVSVCVAADTYHLPELQELAKTEANRLGMHLDVFGTVDAVGQNFGKSGKDMTWLFDCLKEKIEAAFHEDHTTFVKNPIFERSNNSGLNSFLAQSILNLYSDKISTLLPAEHGTCRNNTGSSVTDTEENVLVDLEDNSVLANNVPTIDEKVSDGEFPAGPKVSPVEVFHSMENLSLSCPPSSERTTCLTPASSLAEGAEFEMVSADFGELRNSAVSASGGHIQCVESDSTADGEKVACPYVAQHITSYDWKECNQCRAFVQRLPYVVRSVVPGTV